MAISFARINIHSRAKGHSAVAAAAYRAGIALYDSRLGKTFDFSNRADVIYSEILLPDGASSAFLERDYLWNQVEQAETRKNAQVAKDIELALPKELDAIHQIELAKRFAHLYFVSEGIPADVAIHDKGDGNPHAHILITTRRLEGDRFARHKARDLNPDFAKGLILDDEQWNQRWRDMQNDYFEEHNLHLSVDLDHLIPEKHHGGFRNKASHFIREENEGIKIAREEIALNHLDNFINLLSIEHSVFTRRDIEVLLFKTLSKENYQEFFQVTVERVLGHKQVMAIGENDKGEASFTTRHQFHQESRLMETLVNLHKQTRHDLSTKAASFLAATQLSEEQQQAFEFLVSGGAIRCVVGRPGTGKSYLLAPLREFYEKEGYRVLGAALSGKIAKQLEAEAGLASSTIASLSARLLSGKLALTTKDVLIIDEASMVDFANLSFLIDKVHKAGAKLILVGDPDQLKPIKKGALFKSIAGQMGSFTMDDIRRQRHQGDRQASIAFARGDIEAALAHYQSNEAIHVIGRDALVPEVIASWQTSVVQGENLKDNLMLAHANATVDALNQTAREALKARGILHQEEIDWVKKVAGKQGAFKVGQQVVITHSDANLGLVGGSEAVISGVDSLHNLTLTFHDGESIELPAHLRRYVKPTGMEQFTVSVGERLLFKQADKALDVKNGDIATVTDLTHEGFTARLDSGAEVTIPKTYRHLDYAYALTVHKAQGVSVENAFVCLDTPWWDKALGFVAFTRHKERLQVFASKGDYPDCRAIAACFAQERIQDNVIDYPLRLAQSHGFAVDALWQRAVSRITQASQAVYDKGRYLYHYAKVLSQAPVVFDKANRVALKKTAKEAAHYLELKARLVKRYQQLEREAAGKGVKMQSLAGFTDFYRLSCGKDKKAVALLNQASLKQFKAIDPEVLATEALRHEKLLTIRALIKEGDKALANPELASRANSLCLNADAIAMRQELKKAGLAEEVFIERLQTLQQNYRQQVYKDLEQDYPLLKQYKTLEDKRVKLTGFAAEQADKTLLRLSKAILADKPLQARLTKDLPILSGRIQGLVHNLGKELGMDR